MPVEIFVYKMTDHMESARIVHWLVREGDQVRQQQPIIELETDKATAELESPASGILKGIRPGAVEGATVPVGDTIAFIAQPGEEVPSLPPLTSVSAEGSSREQAYAAAAQVAGESGQLRAAPAARRLAKELGIDLSLVTGTGPQGRIKEEDVRAFASKATPSVAAKPIASLSEQVEWLDLTTAQRLTGQRMIESLQTAPQFSLTVSADMTNSLNLRETLMDRILAETGTRLSITALIVKIVATVLKHHPRANASFENGRVKLHKQVHIGVAVGTDEGLVVPVVKDADQKPLVQIVRELDAFQKKTRQMRFTPDELSGGTFTLSNLGMYGVDRFNAIINPPQSAILAIGRVIKTPVALPDDTIALRPTADLTLSVDHRVMDGVQGAQFLTEIKERLEKLEPLSF